MEAGSSRPRAELKATSHTLFGLGRRRVNPSLKPLRRRFRARVARDLDVLWRHLAADYPSTEAVGASVHKLA